MSRFNETVFGIVEEYFFGFVWGYAMLGRDFIRNLGQPDEVINVHLSEQLELDRQVLLRVLTEIVKQLHALR
jgi:hypothetical protein